MRSARARRAGLGGGGLRVGESENLHADWCRSIFDLIAEGGVWGIPRSGLLFRKEGNTLRLLASMPHDPAMPVTPVELDVVQASEFEQVRSHFAAAGITVTRD